MPVYHLVFHSFESWFPDHLEGYYDRAMNDRLPRNDGLGQYRRIITHGKPIEFSASQQTLLLRECRNSTGENRWQIHAIAVVPTHMHVIVSWDSSDSVTQIKARLKQHLTRILSVDSRMIRGRWFSRGAGANKIRDMDHLIELVKQYLPGHGDNVWIEDRILSKF